MKRLRRRILLFFAVLSFGAITLCALAFQRWQKVTYLQRQLERSWEISYNISGSPPMLPSSLRRWAEDYFRENYGSNRYPENYSELLNDRFRSLFLGKIRAIDIWYPGQLGKDLGGALNAFPHLEELWMMDHWGERPVGQWEKVTEALAGLKLRKLALQSVHSLTPKAIETLSGSKSLHELTITGAEIKEESFVVFTRWKTLKKLVLEDCRYDPDALKRLKEERPTLLATEADEWGFCRD